jgi:hypothetical protein
VRAGVTESVACCSSDGASPSLNHTRTFSRAGGMSGPSSDTISNCRCRGYPLPRGRRVFTSLRGVLKQANWGKMMIALKE